MRMVVPLLLVLYSQSLRNLVSAAEDPLDEPETLKAGFQKRKSSQRIIEIDTSDDEDIKPYKHSSRYSILTNPSNGKKRTSTSHVEVVIPPSKRQRLDTTDNVVHNKQKYQRILTHTLDLHPVYPAQAHMNGEADPSIYPDTLPVHMSSFPIIRSGKTDIARLLPEQSSKSHPHNLLASLDVLRRSTDLIRLECGVLTKVIDQHGSAKKSASKRLQTLAFHYTLDIHVCLDLDGSLDPEQDGVSKTTNKIVKEAIALLLEHSLASQPSHRASIQKVSERSNVAYEATDLEWFYSCLPRPPVTSEGHNAVPDRKGKGRARDVDDDIDITRGSRGVYPPGLIPQL